MINTFLCHLIRFDKSSAKFPKGERIKEALIKGHFDNQHIARVGPAIIMGGGQARQVYLMCDLPQTRNNKL